MTEISMDKQYQTRDGREVRILCTDGPDQSQPVCGIIGSALTQWNKEGRWLGREDSHCDLVEVPETLEYEFYVTVEPWDLDGLGYKIHRSMSAAQEYADGINVMAVIKCKGTFEEGDGLEGVENNE